VWGILLNLATFAAAAVLISRLRVRSTGTAGDGGERLTTQVTAGITALRRNPQARMLVAFAALGTAIYGASTVLYVPMSERFGTGADGYSYLLTAAAIGGVLGAAAVSRLSASPRLSVIIEGGVLSLALPFAATALITSPVIGFVLQVISGGGMVVVDVLALTTLQRDLPRDLLSRVIRILETAARAAALAASFAVAALIREVGLTDALLVVGLGFPVIAAAGLRPLMRAEARTARAVDASETRVPVFTESMLATAASPVP
jgi:predicted MFS family arabinose efflux permease